jgi:hypothetical protein
MSIRRNRKAAAVGVQVADLLLAAPLVAAHRLSRLALAGHTPSRRDRREFALMGAEKAAAFHESWNAMFSQSLRIQQEIGAAMWRSYWLTWLNAGTHWMPQRIDLPHIVLRVMSKGMAPVQRRAVANARRLHRTRLRRGDRI